MCPVDNLRCIGVCSAVAEIKPDVDWVNTNFLLCVGKRVPQASCRQSTRNLLPSGKRAEVG